MSLLFSSSDESDGIRAVQVQDEGNCPHYAEVLLHGVLYSPVYTRPLNQFGSQLSSSWLSVNALNRFTSRFLNRFVNHAWEVVLNRFLTGLGYVAIQTVHV